MKRGLMVFGIAISLVCLSAWVSFATPIFSDDFNFVASPLWGNESRTWEAVGGVYSTNMEGRSFSSLPFDLTDFVVDVDINDVWDGGIFLRSEYNGGFYNGISLITGGEGGGGHGLYWHAWQNGEHTGILNPSGPLFSAESDIHIRIEVQGNIYSAFVNGSLTPATTLTSDLFSHGQVALFNNKLGQSFDNIVLTPVPGAVWLLGAGLIGLIFLRRKPRK